MRQKRHRGFTLIEALIVVVIIAVLAATIVPQFSTSSIEVKTSNLKFNLHTVRQQLEVYKKDHLGKYPSAAASADIAGQLTQKTAADGRLDPNGAYGPYLQGDLPVNPFNLSATVAIVEGGAPPTEPTGSGDGWQYNPSQGWFYPNDAEYFKNAGGFANPN